VPDDQRRLEYVPIGEVVKARRNPKKHDLDGIKASMDEHGVVELPAMDERTGRLVAGHGRLDVWQAAYEADEPPPGGVQVRDDGVWLVPVIRGYTSKSDAHADAYLIGSNRLTENGGWDDPGLARLLADIHADDARLLKVTGVSDTNFEALLRDNDILAHDATGFLAEFTHPQLGDHTADNGGDGPGDPWQPGPDGDDEGDPAPTSTVAASPYGDDGTASEYAPVSWVLHATDRTTVRTALRHAQKAGELATSAAALVAICTHYLEANDVTDHESIPEPAIP
jgi:hypothetical protein